LTADHVGPKKTLFRAERIAASDDSFAIVVAMKYLMVGEPASATR
jgi:hypothetical protein